MTSNEKKPANKPAAKKDTGMGELLGLLKTRPDLVHALVFDHEGVKSLLQSEDARRLVPDAATRKNLIDRVTNTGPRGMMLHEDCLRGTLL